jgi:hypothetical protein
MKKYLELVDNDGFALFVDASSIAAIREVNKYSCRIFCTGVQESFMIKISHFDLIKKMTEIKSFELVKF